MSTYEANDEFVEDVDSVEAPDLCLDPDCIGTIWFFFWILLFCRSGHFVEKIERKKEEKYRKTKRKHNERWYKYFINWHTYFVFNSKLKVKQRKSHKIFTKIN